MQVTETLSDGLKRGFTVILPAADLESRRSERLTSLGKSLRLPGFRPGKVPLPIVKQRYGSAVSAEVLEESVSEATQRVLSERGLRPAMQPKIDMVTDDPVKQTGDLEFKMELELLPDITLPDFGAIKLTRYKAAVPDEDVEKAFEQIAKANRTLEPIEAESLESRGHGVATGEVATIDFAGKVDDQLFEGGSGTDMAVEIGGEGFIPGFAEQIEGAKVGEARTLNVTFPENYGKAELAGKPAVFDITVKQISRQVVPPVDDELAKKIGLESTEKLRELVVSRQQQEYDSASRMRLKKDLLDVISDMISFPVPPSILTQEFDQIWRQYETAKESNTLDEEDKGKDEETLKADYQRIAERRVRLGLLLAEIGRINNITVTEQELDRALYQRAMQYPGQEMQMLEFFRKYPQLSNSVRGPLLEDKVVDYILELASVDDQAVSPAELTADSADDAKSESETNESVQQEPAAG
jgi:trigger factor